MPQSIVVPSQADVSATISQSLLVSQSVSSDAIVRHWSASSSQDGIAASSSGVPASSVLLLPPPHPATATASNAADVLPNPRMRSIVPRAVARLNVTLQLGATTRVCKT
jgi:hypothetical protein